MSAVIENNTIIGNEIILQRIVYIPTDTVIGNNVFITPNTVLTNDRNPPKRIGGVQGPKIRDGAAISANATLLPDISIGEGAPVAAGAIETRDVPVQLLAIGAPAKITDLHLKMIREMTRK